MGHATHFLSRLERVSAPHVELALTLYRDTPLLQRILRNSKLPERADRVAIALEDREAAPVIVVTRDGRFVTCLGEGMQHDLPIISRRALDRMAQSVAELRMRLEQARALTGSEAPSRKLLRRVLEAGPFLSREEMAALCAWRDELGPTYVKWFFDTVLVAWNHSDRLLRSKERHPSDEAHLRPCWDLHWASAHLAVLASVQMREVFKLPVHAHRPRTYITEVLGQIGLAGPVLRGAWAAAEVGKDVLPDYKRQWTKSYFGGDFLVSGLPLVALGSRHRKLSSEVLKAFDRQLDPKLGANPARQAVAENLAYVMQRALGELPDDLPPESEEAVRLFSTIPGDLRRTLFSDFFGKAAGEAVLRALVGEEHAALVKEAPDQVTLAASTLLPDVSVWGQSELHMYLPFVMARAARAAPEDLYLPSEWIDRVRWEWTPEATYGMIDAVRPYNKPRTRTVKAEKVPGRNDPCHCGSGKKFKKCCG